MVARPQRGTLKVWHRDRGFGFIQPDLSGKDVFLHISAVRPAIRELQPGDTILYTPALQSDGRLRATNATIQGVALQSSSKSKNVEHPTSPVQQHKKPRKAKPKSIVANGLSVLGMIAFGYFALLPVIKSVVSDNSSAVQDNSSVPASSGSTITSTLNPKCVVKGNISWNSGRKYYHLPGMEDYDETQIDLDKGERWFCTETEAVNSGWTKAPSR